MKVILPDLAKFRLPLQRQVEMSWRGKHPLQVHESGMRI